MAPAEFKLNRRNGITRRAAFPDRPSWKVLATRISELFEIPIDRIAVSYIDADNDEVTLNTEDELSHFYQSKQSNPIRLFVQDLVSFRARPSSDGTAERPFYRNTFGQQIPIEDEWHTVFIPETTFRSSQHGFVEEVGSVSDTKLSPGKKGTDATNANKGKSKVATVSEVSDDDDSTKASKFSIFDNAPSSKQPIHVYDVSGLHDHHVPALAESTPRVPHSEVGSDKSEAPTPKPQDIVDDPPLPPIEPQTSPSLPDDLTNLFSSLCNVISFHPEVSEGFRSIIRNTSDGTYWKTHREALSRAATEASQASETAIQDGLREAETDAGRRVYGALDTLFRTLSQASGIRRAGTESAPGSSNETVQGNEGDNTAVQGNIQSSHTPTSPEKAAAQSEIPKQERATFVGRSTDWKSFLVPPPPLPVPRAPHIHSPFYMTPQYTSPFPLLPGSSFIPPPATVVPSPHQAPPIPVPPAPTFLPSPYMRDQAHLDSFGGPASPTSSRAPEMADLLARARAATAGKARSQQERRLARKRQKEKTRHGAEQDTEEIKPSEGLRSFIDVTEGPVSQIISNARGPYPQLEMISIPGSFTPVQRHGSFHEGGVEDFRSRAVKRICKQLADMGFTESQFPGLADNVSAQLPPTGSITKDVEDGIVTNLLEELLPLASPIASGSGMRSKGRN